MGCATPSGWRVRRYLCCDGRGCIPQFHLLLPHSGTAHFPLNPSLKLDIPKPSSLQVDFRTSSYTRPVVLGWSVIQCQIVTMNGSLTIAIRSLISRTSILIFRVDLLVPLSIVVSCEWFATLAAVERFLIIVSSNVIFQVKSPRKSLGTLRTGPFSRRCCLVVKRLERFGLLGRGWVKLQPVLVEVVC